MTFDIEISLHTQAHNDMFKNQEERDIGNNVRLFSY